MISFYQLFDLQDDKEMEQSQTPVLAVLAFVTVLIQRGT